ncbi:MULTISPECIES: RcpC/CpaB family pilus assembly protein [unclassified Streptomyces]|uniref:RcpC/CpaB family pilus assembly protein n=1 Tax=unclassified Streptomyces TaxID=2593676 RepID=UPI0036FAE1C4
MSLSPVSPASGGSGTPPSFPRPAGDDVPPTWEVPPFAPVRVRGVRYLAHRLARHRRRAVAAGLAVTAAALVAAGPRETPDRVRGHPQARPSSAPAVAPADASSGREAGATGAAGAAGAAGETVAAPVRIADAGTVRLLRPGDRVDVIAVEDGADGAGGAGGERGAAGATDGAQVVARGARVARLPEDVDDVADGGALVVLAVPRATAARLVGASATARLAVTWC